MKRFLFSLIALAAITVAAQDEVVQTGTPAVLEAANGKKIKVFLQSLENDSLKFQPFKSTKNITVPSSKIRSLKFFSTYDVEGIKTSFNAGEYDAVIAVLEPLLQELMQYMTIQNNMRDSLFMLFESYLGKGDFSNVRKNARYLLESGDSMYITKANVALALASINTGDLAAAEKIRDELESPAASLYLKASIERAQQKPKEAILTVTEIITDHANDLDWLPQGELLNAYLYLDMTGTNSVITTNSAMNTARQVKNIYAGSHVAADARKLWASLGGEAIEAAEAAEKAAVAETVRISREKRKAEALARQEAKRKERKEAAAAKAAGIDVKTTNTETESD